MKESQDIYRQRRYKKIISNPAFSEWLKNFFKLKGNYNRKRLELLTRKT